MPRKLLYIINPIAGTEKKDSLRSLIENKTRQAGIDFEIIDSKKDGNYKSLESEITTKNFTHIIICGGDGTVSQTLSSLYHLPVKFGIIPMGSGNGLARAAKIPMDNSKAIELALTGDAFATDALVVNNEFACMLVGLGFDAAVAHSFAKAGTRGLLTYVKETFKNLLNKKHYPLSIHIDDIKIDTDIFLLNIANGNQYGNEFKIAHHANLNDGLFDVIVVKQQSIFGLIKNMLALLMGNKKPQALNDINPKSNLNYFQCSEIRIENKANAPFHVDGDPANSPASLEIKIIPAAYSLLRTK
jgi:YegS/Rv2252/BmrU family lipid kinase